MSREPELRRNDAVNVSHAVEYHGRCAALGIRRSCLAVKQSTTSQAAEHAHDRFNQARPFSPAASTIPPSRTGASRSKRSMAKGDNKGSMAFNRMLLASNSPTAGALAYP